MNKDSPSVQSEKVLESFPDFQKVINAETVAADMVKPTRARRC